MIKSEYVRNLNKNYTRILLDNDTNYKRYQYCILFRGGIKHLLPCSGRQIDNCNYLYYDISSNQNVKQLFAEKHISREWMKSFLWSVKRLRQELNRFLLEEKCIVWSPEYIYQELEKNNFLFLYVPYYEQHMQGDEDFEKLLEFWVDRIDYDDTALVEFVYHAYEQFALAGYHYLEKQIFEDFENLSEKVVNISPMSAEAEKIVEPGPRITVQNEEDEEPDEEETEEKRGIRSLLGFGRKKSDNRNSYRDELRQMVNGYAVCEETRYTVKAEEYGKTIYIEEKQEISPGLYTEKGELAVSITKFPFVVGKRKEDADYVLSDYSASRVHARFVEEKDGIYLEDLNSTNGTFKNGLRLQPYEKRKIESEDTLRFGKSVYVYKAIS